MGLSIRQLRYFVAVASAGQISAAARSLYVSQSAITASLKSLEHDLGSQVFERSPRGVTLTGTGKALLPKARQILELVNDAETATIGDESVTGRIRVGVSYTVMAYFVPAHLHRLAARYPRLTIDWQELDRPSIEAALVAGELDFGLVLTSNLQDPTIAFETFVQSQRRLWSSPQHPLAARDDLRLAEIAEHPYALLTVDEAAQTTASYWAPLRPDVLVSTSSIEAIRSVVSNGDAVAILSDMVYRPWSLEGRRVETTLVGDPVPDMTIGLAWSSGREFTPMMRLLYEYFLAAYAGYRLERE